MVLCSPCDSGHVQRQRALGFLLVSTLLLAGCGEGDDGSEDAGTTTTAATETTEATEATETTPPPDGSGSSDRQSTDPAKAEQAEAAVLRMEDFPEGWGEQDPEAGLDLEETWHDLTSCLGVDGTEQPFGIATSPTFLRDLATQARSTVEYLPEPQAQEIAAALAGPEPPAVCHRCLRRRRCP